MEIAPFETEHFFAEYEFSARYQLCNSDCESMTIKELLDRAGVTAEGLGRVALGYTESQGSPALRARIAEDHAGLSAQDFMVLATPIEGIYLAARTLLEPEDEVVVLTPAYDALINVFEHIVGRERVRRWALRPTEEGWALDLDRLRELVSPRTKLVVVNFPHNPTGYLPTPEWMSELVRIVEEHGMWLFSDEMYFGLVHSGSAPIPSAAELSSRAVALSGMSKIYGLPGLRTGWLAARDGEFRSRLMNWKFYTSICPPAPSEFLSEVALSIRGHLRERSLGQIEANLRLARAFFERWPELFHFRAPRAGSVGLVDMNVPSVQSYARELVRTTGVLILPAASLGAGERAFRMGFGRAAFGEALERFEEELHRTFARR
ncbi:MAG: pyridoxal phosphate-dependent aminotransferase [Myxococcota bacterium]